ncbi:MAG: NTP transferase domain-containing protein [Candidatus Omnitrophota bacterium]
MKIMNERARIIAMIPARMGSERLARKNLALLAGKPLIAYAVTAAKKAGVFERVVINSEHEAFREIAQKYGAEFYKRPARLATSSAKSDFVVADFMRRIPSDIVVWVNPIAPLQTAKEIKGAVDYFMTKRLDSLITVVNEQVHCMYRGRPVNFSKDEVFAKTQDLMPVQPFVYSVMMWRSRVFMKEFREKRRALFCGRFGVFPVSRLSAFIIKRPDDLMFAGLAIRAMKRKCRVLYYRPKKRRGD